MSALEFYEKKVKQATKALSDATADLKAFKQSVVLVFDTLEDARDTLIEELEHEASDDCEGSFNRGLDEYTRDFIVDSILYTGTLSVEYGRHDKTYYFIDQSKFTYRQKENQNAE